MNYSVLVAALVLVPLGGCTGPVIMGSDAAVMWATSPGSPPPAETQTQIPEHESWCYSTMADVQCYAHAQDIAPERLVNVEPQSRYPLTLQAYRDELAGRRVAPPMASDAPVALNTAVIEPVEKGMP